MEKIKRKIYFLQIVIDIFLPSVAILGQIKQKMRVSKQPKPCWKFLKDSGFIDKLSQFYRIWTVSVVVDLSLYIGMTQSGVITAELVLGVLPGVQGRGRVVRSSGVGTHVTETTLNVPIFIPPFYYFKFRWMASKTNLCRFKNRALK